MDEKAISTIYRIRTSGDPTHPYYNLELRRAILSLDITSIEPDSRQLPDKLNALDAIVQRYLSANGLGFANGGGFSIRGEGDGSVNRIICDDLLRIFRNDVIKGFWATSVEVISERPGFAKVRVRGMSAKPLEELQIDDAQVGK
jgi:hypothetical protein